MRGIARTVWGRGCARSGFGRTAVTHALGTDRAILSPRSSKLGAGARGDPTQWGRRSAPPSPPPQRSGAVGCGRGCARRGGAVRRHPARARRRRGCEAARLASWSRPWPVEAAGGAGIEAGEGLAADRGGSPSRPGRHRGARGAGGRLPRRRVLRGAARGTARRRRGAVRLAAWVSGRAGTAGRSRASARPRAHPESSAIEARPSPRPADHAGGALTVTAPSHAASGQRSRRPASSHLREARNTKPQPAHSALICRFRCGRGPPTITGRSPVGVADGQWHFVSRRFLPQILSWLPTG